MQGKDSKAVQQLLKDLRAVEEAGCSGLVLVLHDMLDIYPGKKARFVKNFMARR